MWTPTLNSRRTAPWWAILAAPALGVPLMITLLALASGDRRAAPAEDATARALLETRAAPAAFQAPAERAVPARVNAVVLKRC